MNEENISPNKIDDISTPPRSKKVHNPFDKVLISKLSKPICSPGMCKVYKKSHNGSFRWDIDQASRLIPADIVPCNSQFEPSPDPAMEKIAEEATERFFSQGMVIPSPLLSSKKVQPLLLNSTDASSSCGMQTSSMIRGHTIILRDVSAQTVLTFPPVLPPELEKILEPFCTFTQDQQLDNDYENANVSLRRKLFFAECHDGDAAEHDDSEQTDEDSPPKPPAAAAAAAVAVFHEHTPVAAFSPELSNDLVSKGMKRTFGTPLRNRSSGINPYRNKRLQSIDMGEPNFSPIPRGSGSGTPSSVTSISISPVAKCTLTDDEKHDVYTTPDASRSARFVPCAECECRGPNPSGERSCTCRVDSKPCAGCRGPNPSGERSDGCSCTTTPPTSAAALKRSASLRLSPHPKSRKLSTSISGRRSLSMSSLNRSRSVQKLDFSGDMSVDGSFHNDSQVEIKSSPAQEVEGNWSIIDDASIHDLVKTERVNTHKIHEATTADEYAHISIESTPIKSKNRSNVFTHEISKMRKSKSSPANMSLDSSLDISDNPLPLSCEEKKVDFNNVDLKYLTENAQFDVTKKIDSKRNRSRSSNLKKTDSGFTDTFSGNTSSYYESAIKPSELTITNVSKMNANNKTALREISNANWLRIDSGFRDETSADSMQFYSNNDSAIKKPDVFNFCAKTEAGNNVTVEEFDRFTDEMTFNCNFSSTPSKNKTRKFQG